MKLLSIHVPSNKPFHFRRMVENLRATAADPACFEVVVKIDIGDDDMAAAVEAVRAEVHPNVTAVISERPKSYYHVWEHMNEIITAADPDYYFCWHVNDEIMLETHHWDTLLSGYIRLFPDDIFRLRISPNKFLRLYEVHEACWGADYPIVPRRWLDVCGGWASFHGADSFQEAISFFLNSECRQHRDVPLIGFNVGGDPPGENISDEVLRERSRLMIHYWDASMTHAWQEDYFRRARRLELAILASARGIAAPRIEDRVAARRVDLIDGDNGTLVAWRWYRLNPLLVFVDHLLMVARREHPSSVEGKPAWFRLAVKAVQWIGGLSSLAWIAGSAVWALAVSAALALQGRGREAPAARFWRDIVVDGLPLSLYFPEQIGKSVAHLLRGLGPIYRGLQAGFRSGYGEKKQ